MTHKRLNIILSVVIVSLIAVLSVLLFGYVKDKQNRQARMSETQGENQEPVQPLNTQARLPEKLTIILDDLGDTSVPYIAKIEAGGVINWENTFPDSVTIVFESEKETSVSVEPGETKPVTMSEAGRISFRVRENPSIDGYIYVIE